jgi:hypothetical protein
MSEVTHKRHEKIHIHCPYCWFEFTEFEQIGPGLDYHHHLYRDFLVFPVENSDSFPKRITNTSYGKGQRIEKINCPGCKREYTIVFLPFGLAIPNKIKKVISSNKPINFISDWKNFTIFNSLVILSFIFFIPSYNLLEILPPLLLLLTEILLIGFLNYYSLKFSQYNEIENKPFILNKNYIKSSHFNFFKNKFFNNERIQQQKEKSIHFLTVIFATVYFSLICFTFLLRIPNTSIINLLILGLVFLGLFLFLYYFTKIVIVSFVEISNSLAYLTFTSTKIPFKISPWNKRLDVEEINRLWTHSLIFVLLILVVIPIMLNFSSIIKTIEEYLFSNVTIGSIIQKYFINPYNIIYLTEIVVILLIFVFLMYFINSNVDRRKNEIIEHIKREILIIKSKEILSYNEIFNSLYLFNKGIKIERMSSFSLKEGIISIIFEVSFLILGIILQKVF